MAPCIFAQEPNARSLRAPKFGSASLSGLHDNLHIMAEGDKEPHQALHRIAPELTGQHSGDLGLINAHELSRSRLLQMPLLDGPVDLYHPDRP